MTGLTKFEFQNYGWWRDETGKLQLGTLPSIPFETEPVAWMNPNEEADGYAFSFKQQGVFTVPLYTAPPQREWQGLTEEEIKITMENMNWYWSDVEVIRHELCRAIEAKLKEKNT